MGKQIEQDAGFGISVVQHQPVVASAEAYPWLSGDAEVPAVLVTLTDGTQFGYGSLIGLSPALKKIAGSVPSAESDNAQNLLFSALPDTLQGRRYPGIGKADMRTPTPQTLFTASRNIARLSRLVFTVDSRTNSDLPTVFRLGISLPKDHTRLNAVLGIRQVAGHSRY